MTSPGGCRDAAITPALKALHTCLLAALSDCGRPVCRAPIVFNGGHPPADACDCTCGDGDGQAWVRWVGLDQATGNVAACFATTYEVTVEVGVYRCAPTPQYPDESTVDQQVETEHALGMLKDAYALRKAVTCCEKLADLSNTPPTVYHESAIGPSGGCVGVELRAVITTSDCPCPEA